MTNEDNIDPLLDIENADFLELSASQEEILQCLLHVSCLHCIQQLMCINIPMLNILKLDAPYMHVSKIDSSSVMLESR
jgi:hypothetical protein